MFLSDQRSQKLIHKYSTPIWMAWIGSYEMKITDRLYQTSTLLYIYSSLCKWYYITARLNPFNFLRKFIPNNIHFDSVRFRALAYRNIFILTIVERMYVWHRKSRNSKGQCTNIYGKDFCARRGNRKGEGVWRDGNVHKKLNKTSIE